MKKEKKHKNLLKNHTFCSVLVISWCVESKEHQPNFSNTCLGRLGRGVYGSNMVFAAKKVKKSFFCWKMEKNNSFFHFLSFLKKNGWLRFVAKKQPNHLFQKIPNFMNETKKFSKSPISPFQPWNLFPKATIPWSSFKRLIWIFDQFLYQFLIHGL